jgi:hypothetical protein
MRIGHPYLLMNQPRGRDFSGFMAGEFRSAKQKRVPAIRPAPAIMDPSSIPLSVSNEVVSPAHSFAALL